MTREFNTHLLLVFYKAYTSTLQRLFLYLTILTVIQEASMTVGYAAQFEYNDQETFCNIISNMECYSRLPFNLRHIHLSAI